MVIIYFLVKFNQNPPAFYKPIFWITAKNEIVKLFYNVSALLHKPICKGFFSDIIFKWRSLHTKSTAQPIGPHITEHSWVAEILPFGLILLRNGMRHQKANKGEIKPTPTQPSNAA